MIHSEEFIVFFWLLGIVILSITALSTELTYGDTSLNLVPILKNIVVDYNVSNRGFEIYVSQAIPQNRTDDVELSGNVTYVVDGDTLDINGIRVRLTLVDTPERGQPGFKEAEELVSSLCLGKIGELDVDSGQRRGDRYGREIGVVYCNGLNINQKLMDNQLAKILTEYCEISEFSKESWARSHC